MTSYEARKFYQDTEAAENYDAQFRRHLTIGNFRAKIFGWREERAFLHMLRQVHPKHKIALDIASGTGRYVELLLRHGYRVGGIDISKEMLSFARQRVGKNPNLLFLKQADAEKLPFADSQFDLVTSIRLYHRIPPEVRIRMLYEVKRVGKGEAILFFGMSTPWLQHRRWLRNKVIPGRLSDPYPVTEKELADEIREVGMVIQDTEWVLPFLADGLIALVSW